MPKRLEQRQPRQNLRRQACSQVETDDERLTPDSGRGVEKNWPPEDRQREKADEVEVEQ